MESGFTDAQARLLLGLIDHESAGTWSETVVGDHGCSHGIAQWNSCVGRHAPVGFYAQVDLIISEMKDKFDKYNNSTAITKHNCPACTYKASYVSKIITSSNQFK